MNSSEFIVNSLEKITLFGVVKWFLVVGLLMYVAFAVVIVRQVKIMTEAVEDDVNGVISLFAWVHLLLAVALVILAIAVL
ncbi:MAG: hypothetical protein UX99_C0012G0013 [Candidatus Amesbacteria bacterium GW2011_GWB1_47_26]|uniref:Uncharacterized protein n=1 Tax=Candidatus Amesbacteria bacterium GW2011_GWC2_45_19 TaxID=1618366 RepID=A0A0G1M3C2_9BACT|nr:MAG: hypothetical protein UX05_C0009G0005 [Candidatus Amesbacteria bacterium GW2011_GWC2_45_19]KKU37743.1 MAG: hypothetical protein UX52_C0019G0005 [Candidatus Amesbacteria bacterium GW2011_GWA1_46_35]KKU69376.1 MAG: hypothetical protein UX93_C0002G0215 [Microgenomates group bacterium GW2011_GWC1_47_20]KKU74528.1 MAG: hypothetical protein UX99_C0012G0013 [Candidatus Amesbacteria bacterium GW2011_GWB1_47_26]KKU78668.1 MAG: hypothetical protein UY06_C0043G0007 [Candidatus Amesbacteria bacteriu